MKYHERVNPKNGMFLKHCLVCSQYFLTLFWEAGQSPKGAIPTYIKLTAIALFMLEMHNLEIWNFLFCSEQF